MGEENIGWLGDEDVTTIIVEAVSKRGKQIIQRLGNKWWLCRLDNVACFDGELAVLIAPEGAAWHSPESRWVRATDWMVWQDEHLRPVRTPPLKLSGGINWEARDDQIREHNEANRGQKRF